MNATETVALIDAQLVNAMPAAVKELLYGYRDLLTECASSCTEAAEAETAEVDYVCLAAIGRKIGIDTTNGKG